MRARHPLIRAVAAAAFPAVLAAQPAPQPGEQVWDRVVAVVGDTTVLYPDVLIEMEAMQAQGQTLPTDPAQRGAMIREIVQRRVDDLILLEAARRSGVTVDPTDVVTSVERQINQVQQQFGSEQGFRDALAQSGRTLEQYRQTLTQQFTDQTMIQRFVQERITKMAPAPVTEEEIRQVFASQADRL